MFRVGQKVVCVDDKPWMGVPWKEGGQPVVGEIYTITGIVIDDDSDEILHLAEIKRGPVARRSWGALVGYGAHRFRPAVDRPTDIAIFKALLNPTKRLEPTA